MSLVLLFALLISADPVASAPVANPEPAKTAAKPQKEPKICRVPSVQTGTRMQRRVCLTESQWAIREEGRSAEDIKTMGSN